MAKCNFCLDMLKVEVGILGYYPFFIFPMALYIG